VDSSTQRQDIRDSLDGYATASDFADATTEDQRWADSSEQRQDIRDVLDGYVDQDLSSYATIATEDQRWVDSSTQRQDIRDVLDGYVDQDLTPYATIATEDQRWTDSSGQRQDLRDACDGYGAAPDLSAYALLATEDQRWTDSSTQRQDIRDSLDGYGAEQDLSDYATIVVEDQRWTDSSTQRQDLRDACDGYASDENFATIVVEDQRWADSSEQRQDIRDSLDGYSGGGAEDGYIYITKTVSVSCEACYYGTPLHAAYLLGHEWASTGTLFVVPPGIVVPLDYHSGGVFAFNLSTHAVGGGNIRVATYLTKHNLDGRYSVMQTSTLLTHPCAASDYQGFDISIDIYSSNLKGGDKLGSKIYRYADDALDTNTGAILLSHVTLTYQAQIPNYSV